MNKTSISGKKLIQYYKRGGLCLKFAAELHRRIAWINVSVGLTPIWANPTLKSAGLEMVRDSHS